ncbi:MAG TPA: penicillin acylase family protein [Thermoleophilaceae bacterium]|nr:penicillin acylase family protein [Thermoleophilaceae bacterium]
MSRRALTAVLTGVLLLLAAAPAIAARYEAEIRRTEYGIPHIKAHSWGSVGFGFGYAFAKDNICTMADTYVTVDAERSRYFGPDGTYRSRGNGVTPTNLDSDFFWRKIIDNGVVEEVMARKPPLGPRPAVKKALRGYVAGYNRYLRRVGVNRLPDPTCRGKEWVRPITLRTAYRRLYQLLLLASQGVAMKGIAGAQPPTPDGDSAMRQQWLPSAERLAEALAGQLHGRGGMGSNAVAVGREGTRDGEHGLLLGNPHFPWYGPERFYQFGYSLPGKARASGAALFGAPVVQIGYTPTMAWSHTVSTAFRFTPYQLTLVPGDPTSYLVDGEPEEMTKQTVTVQVRQEDGSLEPSTRTLYSSRWGPVMTELAGIPLPWTAATAFAMADVNADNVRAFNHFFEFNQARSAREALAILKRYQGIPWVNTIVADKKGNALYADIGAVPNVPDSHAGECNTVLGAALFEAARLPVLDGSRSECAWLNDPDAVRKGTLGPGNQPYLLRRDYVTNSNDSYWLSNPEEPLEGFARIIGNERTERTVRTRLGLIMVGERIDGSDGLGPSGFTRRDMQRMVFNNRAYLGELARDDALEMCREMEASGGVTPSSSGPVPLDGACDALEGWDLRANVDSRGELLFRRFGFHTSSITPSRWSAPFDPTDPVHTPNTLNTTNPLVRAAFGDAITDLREAGIPLDAPLGEHQYVDWGGSRIPVHGGDGELGDGTFNLMLPEVALFPDADNTPFGPGHGSSYVQVVTWSDGRCPNARSILTYSLSENPRSKHRADQTRLYSRKGWVRDRFCESQIRRSPALKVKRVRGRLTSRSEG